MPHRIPVSLAAAGLMAVLAAGLSACGSSPQGSQGSPYQSHQSAPGGSAPASQPSSSSSSTSSPPVVGAPMIRVVNLAATFSPDTLQMGVGQKFFLSVSKSVQVSGLGVPSGCPSGHSIEVANGMMSVQCQSGGYYYTGQRAGTTALTVTVRPHCTAGTMCPQWVKEATLRIAIS